MKCNECGYESDTPNHELGCKPKRKTRQYAYPDTKRVDVYQHKLMCGECNRYDEDGKYIYEWMKLTVVLEKPSGNPAGTYMHSCRWGHYFYTDREYPYIEYREI